MTPPIVATFRILQPYVVSSRAHVAHFYVKDATEVLGSWTLLHRTSGADRIPLADAVNAIADAWEANLPSGSTMGIAQLQERSGGVWNTVAQATPTYTPSGTGAIPAGQLTMTVKDTEFYNFKIQYMESVQPYPQQLSDPAAGNAAMDSFVTRFTNPGTPSIYPFDFVVSRYNNFMADEPFVSVSVFLNRKVARRIGV